MVLGDFFSEEYKLENLQANLQVGTVYYLFTPFISRQKDKFFLLVATEPDLLFYFISKCPIHPILATRPELQRCQVILNPADYPKVFTKECYVNCTEVVSRFGLDAVKKQVLADMSRIKGNLNKRDLQAVRNAVQADVRTPPKVKRPILDGLDAAIAAL